VLSGLGYVVSVWRLVLFAIPIATLSVLIGAAQFWWFGRRFVRDREIAPVAAVVTEGAA
jgi:uncharacterized membrane protein YccF (DUF307 family)